MSDPQGESADDSATSRPTANEPRSARASDPGCLFCRIVAGELPSDRVHEDDLVIAIRDIAPQAPTHLLILPREHVSSALDLGADDAALAGRILEVAASLARSEGIGEQGYRVVTNVGEWGGQSVDHLHFHLLGGRRFTWPPG